METSDHAMTTAGFPSRAQRSRILLFSQRNIFPNVLYRCPQYEFEDIVCQIDAADLLAPQPTRWFRSGYRLAKRLAWHSPLALNPGIPRRAVTIRADYDLFMAVCGSPVDLLTVNTIGDWHDFARTSVCLLDEFWLRDLPSCRYLLRILARFDVVLVYYSQSAPAIGEGIGRPCLFLPPGVDALLFCPYPDEPARVVDVYSIGRRSEPAHQTLLRLAQDTGLFYVYDSVVGNQARRVHEHRALFANTAKRSRYFTVNPGLIDLPDRRGAQCELGYRYFEGAAAGAIMIGAHPETDAFGTLFDWPDAVLPLRCDSDRIDLVIAELDRQPDRQIRIRRNNVAHALLRHDWVYRWETVLKVAGLDPLPPLLARKQRLHRLALEHCHLEAAVGAWPAGLQA
jgi:Glycosyl transferases group 1